MPYLTPYQREERAKRLAWAMGLSLAAIVLVSAFLDRAIFHATYVGAGLAPEAAAAARDRLRDRDWQEALRAMGYLPTWIALAIALILLGRPPRFVDPSTPNRFAPLAFRLLASTITAGLIAELLKPLVGRLRPLLTDGQQRFVVLGPFRPEGHGFSFGFCSSHAAVAFGAAFTLTLAAPRLGWVLVPLAAGCALTRLMTGAHFTSDVLASAMIAYAIARALQPKDDKAF